MPSLKFQMRLDSADLLATASIASALNARTGSPFANRAGAIRFSIMLANRLIESDLLNRVEAMIAKTAGDKAAQ